MTDLSKERLEILRDTFIEMATDTENKLESAGWSDAVKAITEVLQRREAAEKPVCVVEYSDYMTAAEMFGDEPRRKAVKELYDGALVVGDKLYREPPLPVVPQMLLRELVDVVWQEAKESTEVPSTKWADELIGKVFPSAQVPPVVPDEVPESLKDNLLTICDLVENNDEYCQDIWKACRAAMLQLFGNSEQVNHSVDATDMVNSSVIPKGWALVPTEPTAKMIGAAADRSPITPSQCWRIMLASAPQHGNSQSSISSSNSTGCGVNACNQSSKGDA
ncbi:hypothetical protein [Pectobacterium brasiliense]|uniref:hypothetical protein n=1 Tax=Pectobacterium brasiliense TaxID=180957 RepID=UPI000CE692E0|nr:hypothetical protein [Pectobacterium brasiliense]PPE64193.1 hypothetical protein F152LOC_00983 [Pectobacterium brasiliense]